MRQIFLGLIGAAVVLSGGCGSGSSATNGGPTEAIAELDRLKGTWQVTGIVAGGSPVPADRVQKLGLEYVFNGAELTTRRPDRPKSVDSITLDLSAEPKRMTINKTPAVRTVYAMEGNTLRLCIMVDENPNAGYPKAVESQASPKTDVLTLERR